MLVDALLISNEFETQKQPYSRIFVLNKMWILRIEHHNYQFETEDREYNFEDPDEAKQKLLYYIEALDYRNRTLHIYQDDLRIFEQISNTEMDVDRYWF